MRQIRRNEGMPYYTLAKTTILSKSLSLKAKALLTILLNLPEGWHFTVAGILSFLQEGREAVMSAIRELEVAGYLTKTQVRDAKGRILGPDYVVREVISVTPKSETPATEDPLPEVPEAPGAGYIKQKKRKQRNNGPMKIFALALKRYIRRRSISSQKEWEPASSSEMKPSSRR